MRPCRSLLTCSSSSRRLETQTRYASYTVPSSHRLSAAREGADPAYYGPATTPSAQAGAAPLEPAIRRAIHR